MLGLKKSLGVKPPTQKERDRFNSKVKIIAINGRPHKIFQGYCNKYGYGTVSFRGRDELAHRVGWFLHYGKWPTPCCLHYNFCHIPSCVDHEHCYEGDDMDNYQDQIEMGNHSTQTNWNGNGNPCKGVPKSESHRMKISKSRIGRFTGEKNPNYRFSDEMVTQIPKLYAELGSQQNVADFLGMSQTYVSRIMLGKVRSLVVY